MHGATASDLFSEAERHAKEWDYVQWAEALGTRPLVLVEADDQNHTDMEALATALRQKGSAHLTISWQSVPVVFRPVKALFEDFSGMPGPRLECGRPLV